MEEMCIRDSLISCGMLDETVAALALKHGDKLLARNRSIVRENLSILDDWVQREPHVSYVKPQAGTTALVYYDLDIPCLLYTSSGQLWLPAGAGGPPGNAWNSVPEDGLPGALALQIPPQADKFRPGGQQGLGLHRREALSPPVFFINGLLQLGPGHGPAQIHHLKLDRAQPPKLVDLGLEGHIHPAAGGQTQLSTVSGEEDGVQRDPPGLQPVSYTHLLPEQRALIHQFRIDGLEKLKRIDQLQ